jgi:flagellar basal body-associated protein FliL
MSDKAKKTEEPVAAEGEKKPKAGIGALLTKLPVMLGGVMLVEAIVLIVGFKIIAGGPSTASADVDLQAHGETSTHGTDDGHGGTTPAGTTTDPKSPSEVEVVTLKASNKQSGRTFFYDVQIKVVTKSAHEEKVKSLIASRAGLIQDRIRTIIAQSEPSKLQGETEPGLETLKRQVKYQLDEIIGEGYVDEVLVPRCTPFRTDF